PAVVGRQIKWLSTGGTHTIVGVAPPGLDFPIGTDIWMLVSTGMPVDLIARVAPGSSIEAARGELKAFLVDAAKLGGNASLVGAFAQSLPSAISGPVRPAFVAATLAAGILLLIAC